MTDNSVIERHIMSVLVDNEPGVLARVIGLFSGRGYNIESLTVSETDPERALSRISIVTSGTPMVIEQIKAQLARLVPIHAVRDLTEHDVAIERELDGKNYQSRGRAHRGASHRRYFPRTDTGQHAG